MGIKLIITEPCSIPADDSGPQHIDPGTVVDVSKEDAVTLTRIGRGMYVSKADDPTKGLLTASDTELARWKKVAKPAAAEKPAA
jgi:hypothetical protein